MGSSNDSENRRSFPSIILFILVMVIYALIGTNLLETDENSEQIDPINSQKYF